MLLAHLTLAAHRFWVKRWLEMSNVAHAFLLFVKFSAYVEDIVYRFPYYQRQSEIVEFILDALSFGLIKRSCMWPLIAFFLSLFESPLKTKRKKNTCSKPILSKLCLQNFAFFFFIIVGRPTDTKITAESFKCSLSFKWMVFQIRPFFFKFNLRSTRVLFVCCK